MAESNNGISAVSEVKRPVGVRGKGSLEMADYFVGGREYFENIGKIPFEGRESANPLAFKFYDENKVVGEKTMKEHLRFAVCYWHTFCGAGGDPFGAPTKVFPWDEKTDAMDAAKDKMDAAFEFFSKIGAPYWCFHDRDIAPEGSSVAESEKLLGELVALAKERQEATGVKLLWATANMFSHPRYMNGASTNPDFQVLTHAAAQVKVALDANVELGGENYVFWGGREGYSSLLNTNMKRELDHLAQFLTIARDYGRKIGFTGTFLIEPKPMEPSTHQYDFDAATVVGFLKANGLADDFKLNVEANHATLASHSFAHDLQTAADAGLLGSIDANRGCPQNGWDTDQFSTDLNDTVAAMLVVLGNGGLGSGGLNFDAKTRRASTDLEDIFIGHISGMDSFARGLEVAHSVRENTDFLKMRAARYDSYDSGNGALFEKGELDLVALKELAESGGEPEVRSGKEELYESIINQCIQ